MVEDMISELMLSFVKNDGGRNWNKLEFPDFIEQVISSLDSHISNTIKKELEKTAQSNTNIEDCKISAKDNGDYEELLELSLKFLEKLGASDEELLLFEPYIVHGMKRSDIAKENGITEQEATNIKKRLVRRLPALKEMIKNIK